MVCPVCKSEHHSKIGEKSNYYLDACHDCGLLFVNPLPSDGELNAFYSNYHKSSQYESKIKSKLKRARKRIRLIKFRPKGTFVDIGCNLGFAAEAARQLGCEALGVDVDVDAIARAKQLFPDCKYRHADIHEIAKERKQFDILYSSEVIEHLLDPFEFLISVSRLMHNDSILFLTTPDNGHHSLPKDYTSLLEWNNFRPPEHLLYFNRKSLRRLLTEAGFSRIKFHIGLKPTIKVSVRL